VLGSGKLRRDEAKTRAITVCTRLSWEPKGHDQYLCEDLRSAIIVGGKMVEASKIHARCTRQHTLQSIKADRVVRSALASAEQQNLRRDVFEALPLPSVSMMS
jgi:hypothetical protein